MKTVLFFISSTRHSCKSRLDGVWRFADKVGWRVQAVERAFWRINVREILRFWNPSGVIAECGSGADELTRRAFGDLPVVYIDRDPKRCAGEMAVGSDSAEISRLAAEELLGLGLAHYAYVPYRAPLYWSVQRGKLFAAEVAAAGRSFSAFRRSPTDDADAQMAALESWLRTLPKPCGIFAANDYAAEDVVNAATQVGIRIPDDIAILGVDNDEQICEKTRPKLSSIAPEFEVGGYLAAKLLNAMVRSRKAVRTYHYFKAGVVVRRKSTQVSRSGVQPVRSAIVARALGFINASTGQRLDVPSVVRSLGCSRRIAEMRFRQETRKSILEAINDHLFELACQHLGKRQTSVAAVAAQISVSRNTLDRIFLRRTGLTAVAWRRSQTRK